MGRRGLQWRYSCTNIVYGTWLKKSNIFILIVHIILVFTKIINRKCYSFKAYIYWENIPQVLCLHVIRGHSLIT